MIEAGRNVHFTEDERSSTQLFEIVGEDGGGVFHKTATTLSWSNGFVLSFNIAIPVTSLVQDTFCRAAIHWDAIPCNASCGKDHQLADELSSIAARR